MVSHIEGRSNRKLQETALCSALFTKYYSGDKIEKIERVGHVACMDERRGTYKVMVGNMRERDHLEEPGVDGRIILRWIFRKCDV